METSTGPTDATTDAIAAHARIAELTRHLAEAVSRTKSLEATELDLRRRLAREEGKVEALHEVIRDFMED